MIVFTNGCFDILHRGHIEYLKQSKLLGNYLIVAINSDDSVRRLKGKGRPVNNQWDRKYFLEELRCVDEVIIFEEDTPYDLIKKLAPDIITKGGDYAVEEVVGHNLARTVIIPFVEGYSTTSIIKKI
jgi:D-beta-D-heptose 7-phosphate kinase/D-beta-D-heptose 1-phosphate adenosyltransferase